MTDSGDDAQAIQELHLAIALRAAGVPTRVTEIPPPHYDADPAPVFCRVCGDRAVVGALCGSCRQQIDKGGR